jgi:hypothetical protein
VDKEKAEALEFARKMVTSLRNKLLEMEGIASLNTDGMQIEYDNLTKKLAYWEKQVTRLCCNTFETQVDLSNRL